MEQEGKLVTSWEVHAFDRVNNEWTSAMNHSYDHTEQVDVQELLVTQAPAMRITPSRRSKPESEYDERIVGVGDIHFPFQNEYSLALAEVGLRARNPDTIVLLGDNLDYAMYSRFETRQEWLGSTQQGIDEYAAFLGRLRADHPNTRIVWHEGNHDQRAEKQLRNHNAETLNIKRAGEELGVMTLEFLLRADELNVEVIKGYPSSMMRHRGLLETFHGYRTSSAGLAASKVILEATTSFMTGHTHQYGIVSKTFDLRGEEVTIYGAEAGTHADMEKIPSGKYANGVRQRQNWQRANVTWDLYDEEQLAIPKGDVITPHGIEIDGRLYKS